MNLDLVNDLYLCLNALNHQPNVTHCELNDIVDKLNNIFKNTCNVTFENHEVVNNLPPTNNVSKNRGLAKNVNLLGKNIILQERYFSIQKLMKIKEKC